MAIENLKLSLQEIIADVANDKEEIDALTARNMLYYQLWLGQETVDVKYVRALLNGINRMGYFKPSEWIEKSSKKNLTMVEFKEIIYKWLFKYDVLDKSTSGRGRKKRFNKIIEAIPNFDRMLAAIYLNLPLSLDHKLPLIMNHNKAATKAIENKIILLVYKAVFNLYPMTATDKNSIFTVNRFNILVGFIIKKFLYDLPIPIDEPKVLGKRISNCPGKNHAC